MPVISYPISAAIGSNSSHFLDSYQDIQSHGDTKMHQGEKLGKISVFLRLLLHPFTSNQVGGKRKLTLVLLLPGGSDRSWWVVRVINCSSIPLGHLHLENNFFLHSPETRVWPLTSPRHLLGLRHL